MVVFDDPNEATMSPNKQGLQLEDIVASFGSSSKSLQKDTWQMVGADTSMGQ